MKKIKLLKNRHNRIKRRLELGMGKPGDEQRLKILKRELGYDVSMIDYRNCRVYV